MTLTQWLLVCSALLPQGAHSCDANASCDFPYNNQFTSTNATAFPDPLHPCCKAMPGIFLVDTMDHHTGRNAVVLPPSHGYCPGLPSDVIVIGAPLYKEPHVFLETFNEQNEALSWTEGQSDGKTPVPSWGIGRCAPVHHFYTKYTLAYSNDTNFTEGIPVLASKNGVPDEALLKAAEIIAEEVRQIDSRLASIGIRGARANLVKHRVRYAIFANAERRNDTCQLCKELVSTWDCNSHIDSRGGRDTSLHPEVPHCQEGGKYPTTISEQYGIPYLNPDGSVPDAYCGTVTLLHEFFHTIQDLVISALDPEGVLMMGVAAARAVKEGIYVHHPGTKDDGCDSDFAGCVVAEFHVKAFMTWHGLPCLPAEFRFQSRAEIKEKAPWIAVLIYRHAEDSDWNPAYGARIDNRRDQTFPPSDTCAHAPGSALCGEALSASYIGPPMESLLRDPEWRKRAELIPEHPAQMEAHPQDSLLV